MNQLTHGAARLLTATGRSAIAVIQLTGELSSLDTPSSLFRAANRQRIREQSINTVCFGVWGDPGEDVVLCRTGNNSVEVTCHGGAAAVARILRDTASRGFVNDTKLVSVDDAYVLTQSRTQRTAEILLEQTHVWPLFLSRLSPGSREESLRRIDEALTWSEFGRHLTQPWSVVLCGRPNVGKSSLMNALAGFTRSIVSAQAGTTRDRVTLDTAFEGWPIRITDSAGVRETTDSIERVGVEQTLSALDQADLAVIVLDASEPLRDEDRQLLQVQTRRRLVVAHKSDLPRAVGTELPAGSWEVSSVNGQGIAALMRAISAILVPAVPEAGQLVPVSAQQASALKDFQLMPPESSTAIFSGMSQGTHTGQ
jgi:tRNA modification GTPase